MLKIVFTSPKDVGGEIDKIINLLDSGVDFLHVRKPDYDLEQMINFVSKIPGDFHDRLMIHDHYSLLSEFDLAGINLNRKALSQLVPEEEVDRCFIQPLVLTRYGIEVNRIRPKLVSYSSHGFDEVKDLPFKPDYVFLSPIFDSISKEGYQSAFPDLDIVRDQLTKRKTKVIALGGINDSNQSICEEMGFDGVAMLGHIWIDELDQFEK